MLDNSARSFDTSINAYREVLLISDIADVFFLLLDGVSLKIVIDWIG